VDVCLVSGVCYKVQVFATGRSLIQRSPTSVVCLSVTDEPHTEELGPWLMARQPTRAVEP
jgi:hypothetical protein